MKKSLLGLFGFVFSLHVFACEKGETEIISCSLPGKVLRDVSFCQDNKSKEIKYHFSKSNKIELSLLFNGNNKLKRLVDTSIGVTYVGFRRGGYGYTVNIMNGEESNEYSMSFDVKRNDKVIQSDDCLTSYYSDEIDSKYIENISFKSGAGNDFVFP